MFEYIRTLTNEALAEMAAGEPSLPATARVNRAAAEARAEQARRQAAPFIWGGFGDDPLSAADRALLVVVA